jgi:hypothetical protein
LKASESGAPWRFDDGQEFGRAELRWQTPCTLDFAKCGKISIFERGSSAVRYAEFDTVNQCSCPGQERRCNINTAQVCALMGWGKSLARRARLRAVAAALPDNDRHMLHTVERLFRLKS